MIRFQHTIIVGGTGMLQAASLELAQRSESLTSIARTEGSLRALDARIARFSEIPGIDYQPIILGFFADGESGGTRWLTDSEISQGVLEAIEGDASPFVVGRVRPWDRRP